MVLTSWNIQAITGYEPKTTFWSDFDIADHFGRNAIRDTFNRAFAGWKDNVVYLTELVMVLNWKLWQHYESRPELGEVYSDLYETASLYAEEHLTGEDLSYYYRTTD